MPLLARSRAADRAAAARRAPMPSTMPSALRRRPLRRHPEGDRRPRRDRPCDGRAVLSGARRQPASLQPPSGPSSSRTRRRPARCAHRRRAQVDAAGLKTVHLNNRVRRVARRGPRLADPVLAGSGDAPRRRAGGVQIARPGGTAALDAALAKETDAASKRAMERPRGRVVLGKADARRASTIAAVAISLSAATRDALAMLRSLTADAPPSVDSPRARRR